jgi:hypothetical protein
MSSADKNKKNFKPDRLQSVLKKQQQKGIANNDDDDEDYYIPYVAADESLKVAQKEPVKIVFSTSCQYYWLSLLMACLCPASWLLLGIIPLALREDGISQSSNQRNITSLLSTLSFVLWILCMTFLYPRRIQVMEDGSIRVIMWLFLTYKFTDIHEAFGVEWPRDLHIMDKRDAIKFSTCNSSRVIVSRNHQKKDLWVSPNLEDRDEFLRVVNEIAKDAEYVHVEGDDQVEHGCVGAQAKPTFLHFYEIER